MIYGIIAAIIWIVGIFLVYKYYFKESTSNTKFEKIYFSIMWPLLVPLYVIHYAHNKLG